MRATLPDEIVRNEFCLHDEKVKAPKRTEPCLTGCVPHDESLKYSITPTWDTDSMRPLPHRPVRPGGLTLLCVCSSAILLIISQASFFKGPGGLALIIPWLAVLGLHLTVGPVAIYAAWKQGPSLFKPSIYLYFTIFAAANIWLFVHGSGLDREVQTAWQRHGNPLEAELHATLQELEMEQARGNAPGPEKAAIAEQFVRRGADCNYQGLYGKPFLQRACALGLNELALTMLQHGAAAGSVDSSGVTPLHEAAARCATEVVEELLRRDAPVDARDAWKNTPLLLAARAGRGDNVEALLARRPDVNAADQSGRTPLIEAIARNDAPMVQALLQAGADANGRDLRGSSVLALAAVRQDRAVAKLLQEYGAVLNAPGHGRDLPLREALRRGRLDEAGALVGIGADVNATTAGGDSLLAEVAGFSVHYSSGAAGKHDIMSWLLRNGADPEGRDRQGRTALAIAEKMKDGTSADLLLKAGAKP